MDPGYGLVSGLISAGEVDQLLGQLPELGDQAGSRSLLEFTWCQAFARDPRLLELAQGLVGNDAQPVRAILFDKVAGRNWTLGWHQDTKIAVRDARPELPGYSAWSVKEGVVHVLPPVEVLQASVALRLHLDPCPATNGPLQVIPFSHRDGLRDDPTEAEIATAESLTAEVGDVIWMRPLVFHGSSRATSVGHRRVLHIEYCAARLPEGLEWAWANQA